MDAIINNMDDIFIHMKSLPRRMPATLPVVSIGYLPAKRDRIQREFGTVNFSIILSGHGFYRLGNKEFRVQAPAILMQWPGVFLDYGPEPSGSGWEELFLIYDAGIMDVLASWGLCPAEKPMWPLRDSREVRKRAGELIECMRASPDEHGMADRMDRMCELLILESRRGEEKGPADDAGKAVMAIRDHVAARLGQHHDFDALAKRHGLSSSTFRRRWAAHYETPPHHYLLRLRIREATRLLVESSLTVGEIAARVGYDDPLYFSRRFTSETGMTATEYRRRTQVHMTRGEGNKRN